MDKVVKGLEISGTNKTILSPEYSFAERAYAEKQELHDYVHALHNQASTTATSWVGSHAQKKHGKPTKVLVHSRRKMILWSNKHRAPCGHHKCLPPRTRGCVGQGSDLDVGRAAATTGVCRA